MSPTDDAEACCALGHVEEAGELNQLVALLAESGGEQADAVFPRFAAIVSGWDREGGAPCLHTFCACAAAQLPPLVPLVPPLLSRTVQPCPTPAHIDHIVRDVLHHLGC